MDSTAIVIAVGSLGGTAVLGVVGWSIQRNVADLDRRLSDMAKKHDGFVERSVCELRHVHIDAEIERRGRAHHDLANEMQAVKLMLSRLDKRLAVFMAAIAKDKGIEIPEGD